MDGQKATLRDMLRVLSTRDFCGCMLSLFAVAIMPTAAGLYFILKIERWLGLNSFMPLPYRLAVFFILSLTGFMIIWRAYTYLVVFGEGSPVPYLGGTKKLVTIGPYAYVRHPSVIGKLLGAIGLGCLFGSAIFTFVIIPLLLAVSLFYNRYVQEKECEKKFGQQYLEYRKKVPLIIPKLRNKISKEALY